MSYDRLYETDATRTLGKVKYDGFARQITVQRMYLCDDDPEDAISDLSGVPDTIDITVDGDDTKVYLVDYGADRFSQSASLVTLMYEGFNPGIVRWDERAQGQTENLIVSLDDPPQAMNADNIGEPRIIPLSTLTIVAALTADMVEGAEGQREICELLVGSVNEDGWSPDFFVTDSPAESYSEGYWLFSMAELTRQRSPFYVCTFQFEHLLQIYNGVAYPMHQHPWAYTNLQPADKSTTGDKTRYTISILGNVRMPRRYLTAGNDLLEAYNFGDLNMSGSQEDW